MSLIRKFEKNFIDNDFEYFPRFCVFPKSYLLRQQSDKMFSIRDTNCIKTFILFPATHIAICIIISITGFLCAFSFGSLLEKFDYNCILYTDIHFINNSAENASTTKLQLPVTIPASFNETDVPIYETLNSTNTTEPSNIEPVSKSPLNITIDHENTLWRPQTSCHFTQFVPIISMIFAIILGTFFFLAPKGGKGHHSVM